MNFFKGLAFIGFCVGAITGCFLFEGMGVVGCLAALLCGAIGAVCLPVGIVLLGLAGWGAYAAYTTCTKPAVETEKPKSEPEPIVTCNPNEQGAKLLSSLESTPLAKSNTINTQDSTPLLAKASPVVQAVKPGLVSRIFAFFGRKEKVRHSTTACENKISPAP